MTSIRRTLLLSMLLAMAGFVAIAALVVDHELADEFGEVYDAELAREAGGALGAASIAEPVPDDEDDDPGSRTVVLRWTAGEAAPRVLAGTLPAAGLAAGRPRAAGYGQFGRGVGAWRTYAELAGDTAVLVAQPLAVRAAVVRKIERRFLVPTLLLALLAALVVPLLVARGLAPLRDFAAELSLRSPAALQPVESSQLPAELRPVAAALNRLLERLQRALAAQQTFVADAAHELLTPLTALDVHTQALARARSPERAEASRLDLQAGLARCIRLARQLLALARQGPDALHGPSAPVDLPFCASGRRHRHRRAERSTRPADRPRRVGRRRGSGRRRRRRAKAPDPQSR
jgi:two-component system, OmpR family, sensor kinase